MSSATTDDDSVKAYYRDLCGRIKACRPTLDLYGKVPSRPPASESHLQAAEAKLGFPIPPLLRLLYREVADGGWGLIDAFQELVASADLIDATSRSRTGWRLHPAIERALQRHRGCSVLCDEWPDRFITIGPDGECDLLLDAETGWIYSGEVASDLLPPERGEIILSYWLTFLQDSLAEICELWLARYGFGDWPPAASRNGSLAGDYKIGYLTPDLVAVEDSEDSTLVWRGLYRKVPRRISRPSPIGSHLLVELFDEQGEVAGMFMMPDVESE